MLVFKVIPLNEVYDEIDGPILVMLAALIPVSDALRTTGGTEIIAQGLASLGQQLPPAGALALILVAAMMVTPFPNNAATVLVMAPIATSFAAGLGFRPEAFLMAVAIGAGCDFLTPSAINATRWSWGRVATNSAIIPGLACRFPSSSPL